MRVRAAFLAAVALAGCPAQQKQVAPDSIPLLSVISPKQGEHFTQHASVQLSATATDREDGVLTPLITWTDDRGDFGGVAGGQPVVKFLTPGQHAVSIAVADSDGNVASTTRKVMVTFSDAPVVTIAAPADGSSQARGEVVTFRATAVDIDDGDLTNAIVWTDAAPQGGNDADPHSGGEWKLALTTPGQHTITATVQGAKASGSASLRVTVLENNAPIVTVVGPPRDGDYVKVGQSYGFTATATDPDECPGADCLSREVSWTLASPGGDVETLGMGASAGPITFAEKGEWVVAATVQDHATPPAYGRAQVRLHAVDNLPPICTIVAPSGAEACDFTFLGGETVKLEGYCVDPDNPAGAEARLPSAGLRWTDQNGTWSTTGTPAAAVFSDPGTHVITLCADDAEPAAGTAQPGCTQVTLTILDDTPPSCSITAPADGALVTAGVPSDFTATAEDAQDPAKTCRKLHAWWTVTPAGGQAIALAAVSVGQTPLTTPLTFPPEAAGPGEVALLLADSGGMTARCATSVVVNRPPVALITAVRQGTQDCAGGGCAAASPVHITGSVADPDPNDGVASWELWDSTAGLLSSCSHGCAQGIDFTTGLDAGRHRLELVAVDARGARSVTGPPGAAGQAAMVELSLALPKGGFFERDGQDAYGDVLVSAGPSGPRVHWIHAPGQDPAAYREDLPSAPVVELPLGDAARGLGACEAWGKVFVAAGSELAICDSAWPGASGCASFGGLAALGLGAAVAPAWSGGAFFLGTDAGAVLVAAAPYGIPNATTAGALSAQVVRVGGAVAHIGRAGDRVWVATDAGAYLVDAAGTLLAKIDEHSAGGAIGTQKFAAALGTDDGRFAFFGSDRGLARLELATGAVDTLDPVALGAGGQAIRSIAIQDGVVWFGGDSTGLLRLRADLPMHLAVRYGSQDGLASDVVTAVAAGGGFVVVAHPTALERVMVP